MADLVPVHLFRRGNTVVSAAPLDAVITAFGGGGLFGEGGVDVMFGGCAFFRDDKTGPAYVGVWGARKASRFRTALRQAGLCVEIVRRPPPARLMFSQTRKPGQHLEIAPRS